MRSTIASGSHRLSRVRLVTTVTYRDSVVAVVTAEAIGQSRAWWRCTGSWRGRSVTWPEDRGGGGPPR